MHWHWQNLNENGRLGGPLREGRWWLHFGRDSGAVLGFAWHIPTHFWHLSFEAGGGWSDDDLKVSLGCGLFAIRLHTENLLPRSWLAGGGREVSVSAHGGALRWSFWMDSMVWRASESRWRRGSFFPLDFLLGKQAYSERTVSESRVTVPMPEGGYPATVRMFESTWKRPRWAWPARMLRATITPDKGVPRPGKGENSWDIGDDATYAMTCPAQTPEEAVRMLAESVTERRRRHGGKDWKPAESAPKEA